MKKLVILILVLIIFLSLIYMFRPDSPVIRRDLFLADSLMQIKPDSSLAILQKIRNGNNFTGEEKALYSLLMVQAKFRNRLPVTSDSLIRVAVDYYNNTPDSVRKAWSNFYLGRVWEKTKDNEQALICYQKALSAASATKDYKLLAMINSYIGVLFQYVKPYDDGLKYYKKALEYCVLHGDTSDQIFALTDLGTSYILKKEYPKALQCFGRGITLARLINDQSKMPDIYNIISFIYKEKKDYKQALNYVNKGLSYREDSIYKRNKYYLKSNIFATIHQYDSARYYLTKSGQGISLVAKAAYYSGLAKLDANENNYKAAYDNMQIYVGYLDSIKEHKRVEAIVDLQEKYKYSVIQYENSQLRIARQQMHIVLLAVSLITLIFLGLFVYYYNRKRTVKITLKEEMEKMRSDLVSQSLIHAQEKTVQLQEHQNELFAKEQELGMFLSKQAEELSWHIQKEQELKEYIFKMDDIVKKINSLNSLKPLQRSKSESLYTLSFEELSNLEEAVNLCYDQFAVRLRNEFPKLKDDDVHLCCLLKMKVPNKNILSLLDTNELTLKKRRYRIKHDKMELPDDIESLDEFLSAY